MELSYGILSTSSIAPRFIGAVRSCGKGKITAISSRTLQKAQEKAALWDIPTAYGSHEELLQDERVNIVYISNVNSQHYPWAKAALHAGKHVICEKPCTTSRKQTEELYDLAKAQGLFFMEAQKMLFLPAVLAAKERLGELGQIAMVELNHSFSPDYNDWVFSQEAGGGPLLTSGVYAMELICWMFGNITDVSGRASKFPSGVEWQYILTGQTQNGVLFTAKNTTRAVLDNTCRIFGQRGYIELPDYWKARKVIFHIDGKREEQEYPCQYELVYEVMHIADCMEKGLQCSPVITKELSAAAIGALEKIKENW